MLQCTRDDFFLWVWNLYATVNCLRRLPVTSGPLQPKCVDRVEDFALVIPDVIPLKLKATAYNGILGPNIKPLPASCPTGNCTWPTTTSLAICGGYSNSTYQLSCNTAVNTKIEAQEGLSTPVCSVTMPSSVVANLSQEGGSDFQVIPSKGAAYNSSNSSILYITNFDIVGAPGNSETS